MLYFNKRQPVEVYLHIHNCCDQHDQDYYGYNIGVFIPVSALLMHSRQPYLLISQFFFAHSKIIITCENKSWEVEPRNEATCSM